MAIENNHIPVNVGDQFAMPVLNPVVKNMLQYVVADNLVQVGELWITLEELLVDVTNRCLILFHY